MGLVGSKEVFPLKIGLEVRLAFLNIRPCDKPNSSQY